MRNRHRNRYKELSDNLVNLKKQLPESVSLIAVSKSKPIEDINTLFECGHLDFGENKVQELEEKALALNEIDIRWHFIGNLQSNKVSKLLKIPNLKSIHSVSSLKLAEEIRKKAEIPLDIFIQVNTSGENQKGGFEPQDLEGMKSAMEAIEKNPNLRICGLMTIGPIEVEDFESAARKSFQLLKTIRENLKNCNLKLSMGMSSDYKMAIEEGTDFIRVGSKIFGDRN